MYKSLEFPAFRLEKKNCTTLRRHFDYSLGLQYSYSVNALVTETWVQTVINTSMENVSLHSQQETSFLCTPFFINPHFKKVFPESILMWLFMHAHLLQSCPTPCNPIDCNLPGSSVYGISQARILEWVAFPPFLLQGIFPTQGSNLHLLQLLHWQVDSLHLRHLVTVIICNIQQRKNVTRLQEKKSCKKKKYWNKVVCSSWETRETGEAPRYVGYPLPGRQGPTSSEGASLV